VQGFLINPKEHLITEIETDGELHSLYKLLDCHLIDIVVLNDEEDVLYLDDDGLSRSPTNYFRFGTFPNPLAGKGVILGTDIEGEAISPRTVTLKTLETSVTFICRETAISMADAADAAAQEYIDKIDDGWTHIHIPTADIIRSAVYNGEFEGAE